MPHFDHFPRPGESDPYDDNVDHDDDDDESNFDLVSLNDASPGAEGSCSRGVRAAALQKEKGK